MRKNVGGALGLAVLACAVPVRSGPAPIMAPHPRAPAHLALRLAVTPAAAPHQPGLPVRDTVVTTLTWDAWVDDGRGALDSIRVSVTNLAEGGGFLRRLPTTATEASVAQPIPLGTATWTVVGAVCFWRRAAVRCTEAEADLVVTDDVAAPTGVRILLRRVP